MTRCVSTSDQSTNQPTNHHPYTLSLPQLIWSGLVWLHEMIWLVDSMVNRNLRLAARFDARPTHSTLPADILRRTRNPPTQWLLTLLTWLDAARPTHSIPLPALHFIDISCSDQRVSLMTTYISNSLEHTTRSFPSLLRLLSFRKLYLLRRAVTIYCDSLRPIRYTPGNFIR
jgi:hypothetical protein